jgi:hypothetical protein
MIRILPSFAAALVACTPSPQESAMHDPIHDPRTTKRTCPGSAGRFAPEQEAEGRRILSTTFVRVGPDGLLTVELRSGRALVLRDVTMRRKDYCGVQVLRGHAGAQYCGKYSEVAAAKPGGPPAPAEPDLAVPNQVESRGSPAKRN